MGISAGEVCKIRGGFWAKNSVYNGSKTIYKASFLNGAPFALIKHTKLKFMIMCCNFFVTL